MCYVINLINDLPLKFTVERKSWSWNVLLWIVQSQEEMVLEIPSKAGERVLSLNTHLAILQITIYNVRLLASSSIIMKCLIQKNSEQNLKGRKPESKPCEEFCK